MKAPGETEEDYPKINGCGGTHLECGVFPPLLFRIVQNEKQKRRKSAALQRCHLRCGRLWDGTDHVNQDPQEPIDLRESVFRQVLCEG